MRALTRARVAVLLCAAGAQESLKRLFAKEAEEGFLGLSSNATLDVIPSRDIKVAGLLGPAARVEKKSPHAAEVEVSTAPAACGVGTCAGIFTSTWTPRRGWGVRSRAHWAWRLLARLGGAGGPDFRACQTPRSATASEPIVQCVPVCVRGDACVAGGAGRHHHVEDGRH